MSAAIILGLSAFFAYAVESIIGFGGTIIFLGLAGFTDLSFKTIIYVTVVTSCTCSALILLQCRRHVNMRKLIRIFLLALPGVIVGTWMIDVLSSAWLLRLFAVILIIYGLREVVFPFAQPHPHLRKAFIAVGGLIQGVFTTGGPFVVMGARSDFTDKTEMKATMAGFFLATNLWRIVQFILTGHTDVQAALPWVWLCLPVAAGVLIGHALHLRLPETVFKRIISICLMGIGVLILMR